jgi:hypothetical protein
MREDLVPRLLQCRNHKITARDVVVNVCIVRMMVVL